MAVSDDDMSGFYGEDAEEEELESEPEVPVIPGIREEPKIPDVINSSTHRREHARLVRRMESADIATCPEMALLWSGNRKDRNDLLKKWVESGENLDLCESSLTVEKSQLHEVEKNRELLTIREMIEKNFSQCLHYCLIQFFCFEKEFFHVLYQFSPSIFSFSPRCHIEAKKNMEFSRRMIQWQIRMLRTALSPSAFGAAQLRNSPTESGLR